MLEFNIQRFGGRGASSSGRVSEKQTARYKLQQKLYEINANDSTRFRIELPSSTGGLPSTIAQGSIKRINSEKFEEYLNRPAENVTYNREYNIISINLKRRK